MKHFAGLFFIPLVFGASPALTQIPATVTTERIVYRTGVGAEDSSVIRTDTLFVRTTVTANGVRRDYTGSTNPQLPMLRFGSTEIVEYGDSDLTITYLNPRDRTFFPMHPLQLMSQSRKMLGALGMSSQTVPAASAVSVDSVGAGEIVAGYKTVHFRTHITMRMAFGMLQDMDTIVSRITTDLYVAPDLKPDSFPSGAMIPGLKKMSSTFAQAILPGMQELIAQLGPSYARLAKTGRTVRTVISTDMRNGNGARNPAMSSEVDTELIKTERTTVSPSILVAPADYRKADPLAAMMAKSDSLLKRLQSLRTPF